jgi:tetratricopeptide (TPR) repeat protein
LRAKWYEETGDLDAAERELKKEESLRHRALTERPEEVIELQDALWQQHRFYIRIHQIAKAEAARARYAELVSDDWRIPQMLDQEASEWIVLGEFESASQRIREAMEVHEEEGNFEGMAWIKRIQGDLLAAQGRLAEASQMYQEGLALRSRADFKPDEMADDVYHLVKFTCHQLQDVGQAREYFNRAKKEYDLADSPKVQDIEKQLLLLEERGL